MCSKYFQFHFKYCFNKCIHENKIKQLDTDAFDLQEIKRVQQYFTLWQFYSLIVAADIVKYLYFVIIEDNLLK